MKILVCGGRNFDNSELFYITLGEIIGKNTANEKISIISGGAKGADRLAKIYATLFKLNYIEYKANWDTYGKSAGFIRNDEMLKKSNPDYVVAFKGGNGTQHMIDLAKKHGYDVMEIK